MSNRRATVATLATIFAGLALALAVPAEAGGRGHRGQSHPGYRAHGGGHPSVGYYRGGGRYYRPVVHRSPAHRNYGVYGYRGLPHRYAPTYYPYAPVYRSYRSTPSLVQGYRNHLPYPIHLPPPAYGGTVYVDAQPVYEIPYVEAPAPPPAQPQTIYIVVQPPAAAGEVAGAAQPPAYEPEPPTAPADGEPGRVHLRVEPSDATVYLDDELLGSGDEIARVGEPMPLSSGVHVIEVLHPGYQPQRLVFGVPAAGELRVEIDLDGDRRGRKAQVKDLDHGPVAPGG